MGLSIKSIGKALGKVAKTVAPLLPPGFSQAAAFGGSVLDGGNIKSHLKNTASATIGNLLGGASAGKSLASGIKGISGTALKSGGWKALGSSLLGGGAGSMPAALTGANQGGAGGTAGLMERFGSILNGAPSITPNSGSGRSPLDLLRVGGGNTTSSTSNGLIQGLGDFLKGKVTGGKALTLGNVAGSLGGAAMRNPELLAAGAAGLYGAKKSSDAAKRREKAIANVNARYGELAPMRAAGMAGLMNPGAGRPNLAALFADPNDPYRRTA